jgi:RNA polymerase sigma-70 factor (ECF subfamily)
MTEIATTVKNDLSLSRRGDRAAFGRVVTAHHGAALALATRLMGSTEDAEDAVQDALIKTWRALPGLKDDRGFTSWYLRIVYRQCLDARRRRQARARAEDVEPAPAAPSTVERASEREALARVRRAMEQLPPRQQAALHLRVTEQMPYAELSSVLGLTERSARVIVSRARRRLRELVGETP